MQVSNANQVKIYSVTSAARSAIPDWLARRNAKSLKKDQEYRRRIELIQDFEFPEASLRIQPTRDGNYIIATGVYQPQMRVFDLSQKSMKFDRHQDCENVAFEILSDDWTKTIMLQADRTLELHTQFGLHYKTRVPKFGRALAYHYPTCDLMVAGASSEVWRLNLDQGRFLSGMVTDCPAVNVVHINPAHQLFGFGGEDGRLEFWHPRERRRIGALDVGAAVVKSLGGDSLDAFPQITALQFAADGLTYAVGTATGHVLTYDLRSASPIVVKDHQYGFPIKSLHMHSTGNVVSADTKIIKIWNKDTGKAFTAIEPPTDINDVCVWPDSGLVMVANEGVPIQTYYVPQLGPAPKWCAYLDNLTEELEENPTQTMYDDYKFVTRKELTNLGLEHLVGTNVLKAYMHGFFLDLRLYEKAKAIANPFEYDEYKKRMVQDRIEKQRASRISAVKKLPKINRNMAVKLMADDNDDDEDASELDSDGEPKKKNKKRKRDMPDRRTDASAANPLGDARFADLFKDEDFQVDETSHEWKLHHPSESRMATARHAFTRVQEQQQEDETLSDSDPQSGSEDLDQDDDYNSDDSDDNQIRFTRHTQPKKPSTPNARSTKGPSFYELQHTQTHHHQQQQQPQQQQQQQHKQSFEDRLKRDPSANGARESVHRSGSSSRSGNFSITFQPGATEDHAEDDYDTGRTAPSSASTTRRGGRGRGRGGAAVNVGRNARGGHDGSGGRGAAGGGRGGRGGGGRGRGGGRGGRGAGGRGAGGGRGGGRGRGRGH
ncbi:WD40-repeat-containing domain protein [Powellomyces hirtus]|nr:WD40-repeat-containing domain protein [Powellomyces hirtus]